MTTVYEQQKKGAVYEYGTIEKEKDGVIDTQQRYLKYDQMFKCNGIYTVQLAGEEPL